MKNDGRTASQSGKAASFVKDPEAVTLALLALVKCIAEQNIRLAELRAPPACMVPGVNRASSMEPEEEAAEPS